MTKPKLARSRGGKRFYEWREESFWSVTTILGGGVPKPALINWAKKFTSEYVWDNFEVFKAMYETGDRDGAIDWLKGAAFRDRDRKADLGSLVHAATEAYVLGKPFPPIPETAAPRMATFKQFLEDWEPQYVATEATVFNRTCRYAGTLDAIAMVGDRMLLLDTKTGGKEVYPETALQLAAYRYAEFIGGADGKEEPMSKVDGAAVLHLPEEGPYQLVDVRADEEVFRFFRYVVEVYRWQIEFGKSCIRGPLIREPEEEVAA